MKILLESVVLVTRYGVISRMRSSHFFKNKNAFFDRYFLGFLNSMIELGNLAKHVSVFLFRTCFVIEGISSSVNLKENL